MRAGPSTLFLVRIIGVVCGDLLQNCGSTETHAREMSKGRLRSYVKSASGGLLGDLPDESRGTKGVKIRILSKRKNNPATKKGCTKHIG